MLNGEKKPAKNPNAKRLVVFLHGYGSNGEDLMGLAPFFAHVDPDADFAAPDAPMPNAFNPQGFQWFPIPYIDGSSVEEMSRGLAQAHSQLEQYLTAELSIRGLGPESLILVGFSQGTMMSLHTGLRRMAPAGIIGFSGRVMMPELLASEIQSKPAVILIHGESDDVVPVNDSIEGQKTLRDLGVACDLHLSPNTAHSISQDGLEAALDFYAKIIK